MAFLLPWPPSARHYHGFDRAVIRWITFDGSSDKVPVAMVDGIESHRAPRGLWDERRNEWYEWWTSDPDRVSHSCRPAWRCILASFGEVIALAIEEGRQLPPWVIPGPTRDEGVGHVQEEVDTLRAAAEILRRDAAALDDHEGTDLLFGRLRRAAAVCELSSNCRGAAR